MDEDLGEDDGGDQYACPLACPQCSKQCKPWLSTTALTKSNTVMGITDRDGVCTCIPFQWPDTTITTAQLPQLDENIKEITFYGKQHEIIGAGGLTIGEPTRIIRRHEINQRPVSSMGNQQYSMAGELTYAWGCMPAGTLEVYGSVLFCIYIYRYICLYNYMGMVYGI